MFKLASSIGFALALADLKRRIQGWVRSGILAAIGAVFLIVAICFLLVALHLWLSGLLNPIASAAIIGGVLLVIAVVLFLVAASPYRGAARASRAAASINPAGDGMAEGLSGLGAMLGSEKSPLRNPIFQAAGAAIVAGFLLGRKSKRGRD